MTRRASGARRARSNTQRTPWYFLDALDDSNTYATAVAPAGIPGHASGWHVQAWCLLEPTAASASRYFASLIGGGRGWGLLSTTTNAGLVGQVFDGTATLRTSPSYAVQAADLLRPMHVVLVCDGSVIFLYVNGAQVGTSTALSSGYLAGTNVTRIGRQTTAGSSAGGLVRVAGLAGGSFIPTAQEIAAAHVAGRAARDVIAIPAKTDKLWSVARSQVGPTPPSSWVDVIGGSEAMTRTGSPSVVRVAP